MSEGFFSLFGPPPPEVVAQIERQRAAHFMQLEDQRNKIEGLFDELTADQLGTLRALLAEISGAGQRAETAADYYIGWTASVLKFKHGLCSSCGTDHEAEALKALVDTPTEEQGDVIDNKEGSAEE